MKIKFTFGPYGYEVVLGNITEKIYNKHSQDNNLLNDAFQTGQVKVRLANCDSA